MRPQHRRTVERLIERFENDPNYPALLVGGSIARGWERDDSDVDIILLASDEEYARREPARAFHYYTTELSDYPGGYVDGKVVNSAFLDEVAERGSEPARAAFVGVLVAYSRDPELEALLARMTFYPEAERPDKMRSFYAQVQALQWYMGEADKRGDRYLATHVAADLALYGGRLILAHNRVLYPYHKWFTTVLREIKDRPANFMERMEALLTAPCKKTADAFCESVLGFTQWETPPEGWPTRFMQDSEWAWRTGKPPLADW
ncbi:MAG: DUF4037 domain-containing protein [Anaerolineae bacterium]